MCKDCFTTVQFKLIADFQIFWNMINKINFNLIHKLLENFRNLHYIVIHIFYKISEMHDREYR